MKIQLDEAQIDAVTKAEIASLRKQVTSLENKLKTKEKQLMLARNGMDLTKERRAKLRDLAYDLMTQLQDANWADYDEQW